MTTQRPILFFSLAVLCLLNNCCHSATLSIQNNNYAGIQFSHSGMYPATSIQFTISADYFNQSALCVNLIASSSISGPQWMPTLLDKSGVTFLDNVLPVSTASAADGDLGNASSTPTSTLYQRLVLLIVPDSAFSGDGTYTFQLPDNCTATGVRPPAVTFTITQGRRSSLGRLSTFLALLAAGLGAAAALIGASTTLLLSQVLILMSSPSCGPIAVIEEFAVLQYSLVPFDFRMLLGATFGLTQEARLLIVALIILGIVAIEECSRFFMEERLCRQDAVIQVDNFGLPLRSVNAGLTSPTQVQISNVELAVPLNMSASDASFAAVNNTTVSSVGVETTVVRDERWVTASGTIHDYRGAPIPPHFVYTFLLGLMLGAVHFAVWSGFSMRVNLGISALALIAILFFGIGVVGLSMAITRHKSIFFCPYSTQRGNFPKILQPSGVWGPNSFRERNAPFVNPWRKGCKGLSPFLYLMLLIAALLTGTAPTTTQSALLQMGLINFCVCFVLIIFLVIRPFRSLMTNILFTLGIAAAFVASVFLSLHVSSTNGAAQIGSDLSTNAVGQLVSTTIGGIVLSIAGLCELVVRVWELRRGRERRAAREGERLRRMRLLQGTVRASKIEQQKLQGVIQEMMTEIVVNAQKSSDLDGFGSPDTSVNGKRSRIRASSVWRQGRHEMIATDSAPPSLAEYLVQDFDAIPLETREEILLSDEHEQNRGRQLNSLASINTAEDATERGKPDYVQRKHPPCLATLSIEIDSRSRMAKPDYDI